MAFGCRFCGCRVASSFFRYTPMGRCLSLSSVLLPLLFADCCRTPFYPFFPFAFQLPVCCKACLLCYVVMSILSSSPPPATCVRCAALRLSSAFFSRTFFHPFCKPPCTNMLDGPLWGWSRSRFFSPFFGSEELGNGCTIWGISMYTIIIRRTLLIHLNCDNLPHLCLCLLQNLPYHSCSFPRYIFLQSRICS